jgi:hypothetical protein
MTAIILQNTEEQAKLIVRYLQRKRNKNYKYFIINFTRTHNFIKTREVENLGHYITRDFVSYKGHSLTLRVRVILRNLTVSHLVKKFLTFYGTRYFIIVSQTARHSARIIQFTLSSGVVNEVKT